MPQPRLAARRAPLADLPPAETRARIAGAVHRAIVEAVGPEEARLRCLDYAHVGAIIASRLTGRAYAAQYGTLRVVTESAPAADGTIGAFEMRADDPATRGREFHAWFAGPRPGWIEVADLAARHYRAQAIAHGAHWSAGVIYPPYIWTRDDSIPAGVTLAAVPDSPEIVERFEAAHRARLRRLVARAWAITTTEEGQP